MEKKLNPFEENVQSYDVYELANWIYRCKNHIPKPETPQEEEQYVKKVKAFTSQWEAHREANKELYNSKKYHDALIGSNYSRPKIYAKHGKNRVDISELVYPDRMEWIGSLPTKNGDEFKQLLKNNMIHFLGSDVHRPKTIYPKMKEILEELRKILDRGQLKNLTTINAQSVLENKVIYTEIPKKIKKSFWG